MEYRRRRVWAGATALLLIALGLTLYFVPDKRLIELSTDLVYLMTIPATLMPIAYTKFFPWWKSPLGRALFIKALGLLLLVDLSAAVAKFGVKWLSHFLEEIEFAVYALVLVGLSYQLIVLVKIWWDTRKERANERYRAYASYDETPEHRETRRAEKAQRKAADSL